MRTAVPITTRVIAVEKSISWPQNGTCRDFGNFWFRPDSDAATAPTKRPQLGKYDLRGSVADKLKARPALLDEPAHSLDLLH